MNPPAHTRIPEAFAGVNLDRGSGAPGPRSSTTGLVNSRRSPNQARSPGDDGNTHGGDLGHIGAPGALPGSPLLSALRHLDPPIPTPLQATLHPRDAFVSSETCTRSAGAHPCTRKRVEKESLP